MESGSETQFLLNPKSGSAEEENPKPKAKPKVVVVMGPTGSGKSRLSVDLASHFPIEIINSDSMQVYKGLDVLTNKIPLEDQKGVPHHLLGIVSPDIEFTAKDFRDAAIPDLCSKRTFGRGYEHDGLYYFRDPPPTPPPLASSFLQASVLPIYRSYDFSFQTKFMLIKDILSRNRVPVIVGGTNYYIQALLSPFLLDDSVEDMDKNCSSNPPGDKIPDSVLELGPTSFSYNYDCLKDLDPIAANRIHPNDQRKINKYLSLYASFGVLPSKLLQETAMENWGRVDNCRYNCCFICVDASLPLLDQYVEQRVDHMVDAGLLNEVYDIYNLNADYTRGLRQAIGVREFEDFLRVHLFEGQNCKEIDSTDDRHSQMSINKAGKLLKENMKEILNSSGENQLKLLLEEAIDRVKANTRRLVRRQKRRLSRLQTLFGWNIHYVDATESLLCVSNDSWTAHVVEPSVKIIRSYLNEDASLVPDSKTRSGTEGLKLIQRDLWTRYECKACGNRVLRGAHEWEQHKQCRGHRKRISSLRKSGNFCSVE
ncbi:tRNA dimethylallyltransferase 2 isoform X2 [Cornus florida]|uniref:tRNA dimethylallyltransferase 2 isoform X2 n=1 Tax=Cornus florida TaxID=4283 RepID=UPI00289A6607|nr:tRNA dimethylallyltransferase 2 isoform X2 [Cornus florida]